MPLTISPTKAAPKSKSPAKPAVTPSAYAVSEINAYIAIRDELVAEAEEVRTKAKVECAAVANDFVENCLKPARDPYDEQCLPESDAARQRKRCDAVRDQLNALREIIS